ncbi:MAG: 4-hydroxy-tetrahydrodipicolinate reductase [Clostridia bacterium]|nr:4-hydroxy-tetrahydrodipicolinate reductase [Clostridia bacterium]
MDIILCGASGRMGREMASEIARSKDARIVAAVDKKLPLMDCPCYESIGDVREKADVIVDFSHHGNTYALVDAAIQRGLPLVVATTGQNEEERAYIEGAAEHIPVFFCGNMSLGVALFIAMTARVARTFPYADVEIIETHHKGKVDSPSGTALMLASAVREAQGFGGRIVIGERDGARQKGDIGISSVRIGNVVGEHEVRINTGFQTITLKHEAHSRAIFAIGAMHAIRFIVEKPTGLYSVKNFLDET